MLSDDLFSRSLKAEVRKYPRLLELKEEDAPKFAPKLKFGRRRKGFHKANALERVLVLQVFKRITVRGELFVLTKLSGTEVHQGFRVFTQGMYFKYVSLAVPTSAVIISQGGVHQVNRQDALEDAKVRVIARPP